MSEELDIDEVWGLYAEEGGQSLDDIEESLLILQKSPADNGAIAHLFRAMHTYKGNARMLGLAVIESVAHQAEDMIGLVRDEGIALDAEMAALLLEATDCLRGMLELSVKNQQDVPATLAGDLCPRMRQKFVSCVSGNSAANIRFDEPPTSTVLVEVEVEPETTAADATAETEVRAIIFDSLDSGSLANDPVYREIFFGMAHDILHEMHAALAEREADAALQAVAEEVERLRHAAEQIDMLEWQVILMDYLGILAPTVQQAAALTARLQALYELEFAKSVPIEHKQTEALAQVSDDPVRCFLDAMAVPLKQLSHLSQLLYAEDKQATLSAVKTVGEEIKMLAAGHGFVRVEDTADRILTIADTGIEALQARFRQQEFLLYEELAAVAEVLLEDRQGLSLDPQAILRNWCADHIFENLLEMRSVLERIKCQEDIAEQCQLMMDLLRRVFHAAAFYEMETVAHLSMAMVDLFARVQSGEMTADPVLQHLSKSFISDVEIILDTAGLGETPDMEAIEKLLQAAADASFTSSGGLSLALIEMRLGLPKSFHKVLTAENVKTVLAGLDSGRHFYIIRADLNQDEDLAAHFLNWIDSGAAQVISNITIYEGNRSLFDFLITSPLDKVGIHEALLRLDPNSRCLYLETELIDRQAGAEPQQSAAVEQEQTAAVQPGLAVDILEVIGELVTGQAMAQHLLADLYDTDCMQALDAEMSGADFNWQLARRNIRQQTEIWREKLEKLKQLEGHNAALLNRLQDEAISMRVRPAALLLKPLVTFSEVLAQQYNRQVVLVTDGEDLELDFSMLENLKMPLRSLLSFVVSQSIEPVEQRMTAGKHGRGRIVVQLARHEEHVQVIVEDDGVGIDLDRVRQRLTALGRQVSNPELGVVLENGFGEVGNHDIGGIDLAAVHQQLRQWGGGLEVGNADCGGTRFVITLPLAMVVVEGMVVRVGKVQYVIPISVIQRIVRAGHDRVMQISADGGGQMLRLTANEVLPILMLSGGERCESLKLAADQQLINPTDGVQMHLYVVVACNQQRLAIAVNELIGQQQVLIRPLQGFLSGIRGVTGCALLASGDVGMMLDINELAVGQSQEH